MSFKIAWKSNGDAAKYEDASKHFRFTGTRGTCQMEAEVQVSSIGFRGNPIHSIRLSPPSRSSVKRSTDVITAFNRTPAKSGAFSAY